MIKKTKLSTKSKKSSTDSSHADLAETKLTNINYSFEVIVRDLHDVINNLSIDSVINLSQHNKDFTLSELEKIILEVKKSNITQIDQYKERLNHLSSSFRLLLSSLDSLINDKTQNMNVNSQLDEDYFLFEKNLTEFLNSNKKFPKRTFVKALINTKDKYLKKIINPKQVNSSYIYNHLMNNDSRKFYNYKQDSTIYHLYDTYTHSYYSSLRKLLGLEKINRGVCIEVLIEFRSKVLKQLEPSLMDHEKSIEDSLILSKKFLDYLVIYFKDK